MEKNRRSPNYKILVITVLDLVSIISFIGVLGLGIYFQLDFYTTTNVSISLMTATFVCSTVLASVWNIPRFDELRQLIRT